VELQVVVLSLEAGNVAYHLDASVAFAVGAASDLVAAYLKHSYNHALKIQATECTTDD
jgi:hypothetical protein